MSHNARLRRVGGSVMLAIPKAVLDTLDLGCDAAVALSVEAGKLVVDPKKRRRYSLDELLAECKPVTRRSPAEREWTAGKSAGRELI